MPDQVVNRFGRFAALPAVAPRKWSFALATYCTSLVAGLCLSGCDVGKMIPFGRNSSIRCLAWAGSDVVLA